MTLLGKSFTAIILVLTALFMALSLAVNASHRNWRDVVLEGVNGQPGLKAQIEMLSRVNDQLRDSQQRAEAALDREQAARRTALAALQTQLDQLKGEQEESEARNGQYQAQITVLTQTDRSRAQELERLTASNADLRQQIRQEQEQRDRLFAQTLELTDQMNRLRGFKQQLEERNEQLASQVTRFQEIMTSMAINPDDPLDGAPPERNGRILKIDRPSGLVEVSIGYDEGLRRGHTLDVTRRGRYVGKVKVRKTEPDRAVAEILIDYSAGVLQENDRVDTTID